MKITEIEFLRKMIEWLRRRLFRPLPKPPPRRAGNNAKTSIINREDEGAFFYLRDILEQLPRCQKMLKRIRRIDPEAYDYHRRVGARVLPDKMLISNSQLSQEFLNKRPSMGMVYQLFADSEKNAKTKDHIPSSFQYFQKMKSVEGLAPTRGTIYKMALVHDDGKRVIGGVIYFEVSKNGDVRSVKKKQPQDQFIPGSGGVVIHHCPIRHSRCLEEIWNDNKEESGADTLEEYARNCFISLANEFANAATEEELQVRCRRNNVVSLFNVSTKRTPYFFKDRETTLAVDGKRKRIFHIVRAHTRDLSGGRMSDVKEHYRGERRFTWGGHEVTITVPGLHHSSINNFSLSAHEFDKLHIPKDWLTPAQLGARLSDYMEK